MKARNGKTREKQPSVWDWRRPSANAFSQPPSTRLSRPLPPVPWGLRHYCQVALCPFLIFNKLTGFSLGRHESRPLNHFIFRGIGL